MPTLVIANKCYSSWSMRAWLVMRQFGIPFEEKLIPFAETTDSPEWKAQMREYSPAGKVPALVDGDLQVWDSLAIIEYVADAHPDLAVWPKDRAARATARAIAAEMHSGFSALRQACPTNFGKKFPHRDRGAAVARDVERITTIWRDARERFGAGGPFLFGQFSAADAMYAPIVSRFVTYSIPLDQTSGEYALAVLSLPSFEEWKRAALAEPWIVPEDEVDEEPLEDYRPGAGRSR